MKTEMSLMFLLFTATPGLAASWNNTPPTSRFEARSHEELLEDVTKNKVQMHECLVAVAKAARHGNVWQEEELTIDECRARAIESIDLGNQLLQENEE